MKTALRVAASAFLLTAVAVPAFAVSNQMSVVCRFLSGSCPIEKHQQTATREKAERTSMSSDSRYSDEHGVSQYQQDVRDRFLNDYRENKTVHQPMDQE